MTIPAAARSSTDMSVTIPDHSLRFPVLSGSSDKVLG